MRIIRFNLWIPGYRIDFILTVLTMFFLAIVEYLYFSNMSYEAGLNGNPFLILKFFPCLFIAAALFCIVLASAFINLLYVLVKACRKKQLIWQKLFLAFIPFVVILLLFMQAKLELEPGATSFLRGYEKWVINNVDVDPIREWLYSLPHKYSGEHYFEAEDFPGKLPEAITKLKPYHMYLSEFENGQRNVEFEWGCALQHWGIIIGLPKMDMPEKGECIILHESSREYRWPVEAGVYIFSRD